MAIKVSKTQEPEQTTALAQLQTTALFNIEPPKQDADLLPQLKIPYPIEAGEVFPLSACYKAGLFDGKTFALLKTPFVLTVLMAREASRKLVVGPDGKKTYTRAFKSLGSGMDASHPLFEQHTSDPEAEKGASYVLGVVQPDGSCAIAELAAFKVMRDYWGKPLYSCRAESGIGLKVSTEDHTPNLTISKKGTKYLDPKKFRPEQVELTREQLAALAECYKAALPKIEAWKKR